jgi:hypothetical protein
VPGGSKLASMSNESEWATRVSDWRASGKSAREFCTDKDYSVTTLYWWASRLKRDGQPKPQHKPMRLARVVRELQPTATASLGDSATAQRYHATSLSSPLGRHQSLAIIISTSR